MTGLKKISVSLLLLCALTQCGKKADVQPPEDYKGAYPKVYPAS